MAYLAPQAPRTFFDLPAASSAFLERRALDGDKIILPTSVLTQLLNRYGDTTLPQPIIFELVNQAISRTSHCGVLEFTAPEEAAYLPDAMMENMMCEVGTRLRLRLKHLPKLQRVKFQPVESKFSDLPTPKQTLEFALRKFTCLTEGDTIAIEHAGNTYHLKVLELEPRQCHPPAATLIDCDPTVEFAEALEKKESVNPSVEEVATIDQPISAQIAADAYHYYRVKAADRERALKIALKPAHANNQSIPDIYVSTTNFKPSLVDHQWRSSISQSYVTVQPTEYSSSLWLYIGIHSYKRPAEYILHITEEQPTAQPISQTTSQSISSSSTSTQSTDTVYCENCRSQIGKKQYQMHSIQCQRLNVWCDKCNATIKRSTLATHAHCHICNEALHTDELQKHVDLLHESIQCECGQSIKPTELEQHKRELCPKRLVDCQYCGMQLPMTEMEDHIAYEKAKSVSCEICGQNVSRRRMNNHLAAEHRINPSLRADDRVTIIRSLDQSQSQPSNLGRVQHSPINTPMPLDPLEAALRASRLEAGIPDDALADDDAQFQRILEESRRAAELPSNLTNRPDNQDDHQMSNEDDASQSLGPTSNPYDTLGNGEHVDDGAGFDVIDDEFDEVDDWDEPVAVTGRSIDAARAGREIVLCPYCQDEFNGMDAMVEHMPSCPQMTDD